MNVFLVDGTYELFRHYFAVPRTSDVEGNEVGAVRGVVGSMLSLLEDGVTHIGVATPDLDASIAFYRDVMGATDVTEPFVLESQKVRVCFVNTQGEDGTAGKQ